MVDLAQGHVAAAQKLMQNCGLKVRRLPDIYSQGVLEVVSLCSYLYCLHFCITNVFACALLKNYFIQLYGYPCCSDGMLIEV